MEEFARLFEELEDSRQNNSHLDLHEILIIALCTVLCEGEGCSDMALFGRAKGPFLRQFLRLRHGIPGHDPFLRIFRPLDPDQFTSGNRNITPSRTVCLVKNMAHDPLVAFLRPDDNATLPAGPTVTIEARIADGDSISTAELYWERTYNCLLCLGTNEVDWTCTTEGDLYIR